MGIADHPVDNREGHRFPARAGLSSTVNYSNYINVLHSNHSTQDNRFYYYLLSLPIIGGISSVGRALAWHARGHPCLSADRGSNGLGMLKRERK
jgi:uncharacterized protein YraI